MTYGQTQNNTPRVIGIGMVIALHVGVIYALQAGLAQSVVEVIRGPIEAKIIEEIKPQEKEPPPPPPKFEQPPPPFVPPPEVAIDLPAAAPATAITNVQTQVQTPAPPKPAPVVTAPRSDPKRPNSQPEYPPTSRRLGEAGSVMLLLYVQENGRVGDAKVDKSSGFPRLDEAAVREAKRNWRFIPGNEGGKPVAAWTRVVVTFRLTD